MKKQLTTGIIAAVLMLTNISASAQPSIQWTRTLQFEGKWEGLATLTLGGQAFIVDYHTDFKTAIDGNVMTMDESFSDPALGDFKGANLIGYSPYDDRIHWFSADNFGTAHEHTGTWVTPKHFHMVHHSTQSGLPYVEHLDFRLRANNQKVDAKIIATLDGDTVETIIGTLLLQCNRVAGSTTQPDENANEETTVYPNPTSGELIIESTNKIDELKVLNDSGQNVYTAKPGNTEYALKLDTPGIYFVQVTSEGNTETKKIVVEK